MKKNIKIIYVLLLLPIYFACSTSNKDIPDNDAVSDTDTLLLDNEITDEIVDNEQSDTDGDENNLEKGPYGILFGDTAGDFTLPLETGDWNFAGNRSQDENYIFIFYRASNSESTAIWKTDLIRLFDNTPQNTHYFFLVDGTAETFTERIGQLKKNIENSLEIGGGPQMKQRVHITTKPAREIDSWFKEWLEKYSDFFLGIDRFQKIRSSGSFHSWESSSSDPRFEFLYKEAELYNYEYGLEDFISSNHENSTTIKGIDGVKFPEDGWEKNILFSAQIPEFSEKGRLFISLEQICESQKSCEWDRLQHLFLCDDETSENCTVEIGRWITTYGRSGKWLTDITPLISLLKSGKNYFRFTVAGDQYVNYLDFIYIKESSSEKPVSIFPLFSGTKQFDETYNDQWEDIKTEIPSSFEKIIIAAYITGHGNGSEQENCAEFCKFESVFTVNGTPFEIDFKNAGTSRGCFDLVNEGTVPNQYGSWPFGRAGWCPGQDVKLINIDVTEKIKKGELNTFSYSAFLNGENYTPVVTDPSGYRAEIPLSSFLVIY
jgi:hypothetical protein